MKKETREFMNDPLSVCYRVEKSNGGIYGVARNFAVSDNAVEYAKQISRCEDVIGQLVDVINSMTGEVLITYQDGEIYDPV